MSLEHRMALVTGAGSGLGRGIVNGHDLVVDGGWRAK